MDDSGTVLAAVFIVVFVLFTLTIFGVVVFAVVKGAGRRFATGRRLGELALALGARMETGHRMSDQFRIERAGVTVLVTWTPGGKNTPPTFALKAEGVAAPLATLRRETKFDRLGKRLGINREFETGDPDFDRELYLVSDADDPILLQLLGNPAVRNAVRQLIGLHGFDQVEFSPAGVRVSATPPLPTHYTAAGFEPAAAALAALVRGLPAFIPQQLAVARHWPTIIGMVAVFLLDFAGIVAMAVGWGEWPLIDGGPSGLAALAGLFLVPFLAVGLIPLLRDRATSLRNLLIAAGSALVGLPLLCAGVVVVANGALDTSGPITHPTVVTETYTHRNKNSTSYYVVVRSWREGEPTHEFNVGYTLYSQVQEGSPVAVTTRAGRFGWEWLVGINRLDKGAATGAD